MRLYYASDIHGSETCWRKFLNAGHFYNADVLVMGGDIIGKAIVPIEVDSSGDATGTMQGRTVTLRTSDDIGAFETSVRSSGFYPFRASPDEIRSLQDDPKARDDLFERVVVRELSRWIEIAAEKASPEIEVFVMPGNDDPWFIDDALKSTDELVYCDQKVVDVRGYRMLSLSYANRTPWDSPRELDEDVLLQRIESLARGLEDPGQAIFNLHVPPYGTGLDTAPRLDGDLRPVTQFGEIESIAVGSTAVKQAIEEFQPILSLHGHIHESPGARHLGRTLAVNPGSNYSSGRIDGVLVDLEDGRVQSHQFVSG